VTIDPLGRFVFTANGGLASNSASSLRINSTTGLLTSLGSVPVGTAPRALTAEISGRFLYVASATTGTIYSFKLDPTAGTLTSIAPPIASGTSNGGPDGTIFVRR
jgi:6-phosphogluconolactonase (cycloisomerase 2 family)